MRVDADNAADNNNYPQTRLVSRMSRTLVCFLTFYETIALFFIVIKIYDAITTTIMIIIFIATITIIFIRLRSDAWTLL